MVPIWKFCEPLLAPQAMLTVAMFSLLRVDRDYFTPEFQDVAFAFCPISKLAIISSARTIAE